MKERVTILVSGVPPEIKKRALESGRSLNDEVVGRLSKHYDVPFSPNERPSTGGNPESDRMFLRVTPRLANAIVRDAVKRKSDKSTLILNILAAEYRVKYQTRSRRTVPFGGGRKRAPAGA